MEKNVKKFVTRDGLIVLCIFVAVFSIGF